VPAHTFDDERRASDPSTEPEVLEYLAKAFPDLRPTIAANPAVPAVLREQILQMDTADPPDVSPASPVSARPPTESRRLATAETAALPSVSTAACSASPYTATPVGTTSQTDPATMMLSTSPTVPPAAIPPLPASGGALAAMAAPAPSGDLRRSGPDSRPGSHTGLIAALVVMLVLVVATAGTFAGMLLANRGRSLETKADAVPSITTEPTTTEGTSEGKAALPNTAPAAEPSAEFTAEDAPTLSGVPTLPPQAQTYSYQYVDTPSKNISCELYEAGVACSILERSYASSGMQDCSEREFSISVDAGRPRLRCGEKFLGQPGDTFHTLQYGQTTTFSDYACASQAKGMTCWNTITGRGFTLSRESHVEF